MRTYDIEYYRSLAEKERNEHISRSLRNFGRWVISKRRRGASHVAVQH